MLLSTPFELLQGPTRQYIISQFSINRVEKDQALHYEQSLEALRISHKDVLKSTVEVNLVYIGNKLPDVPNISSFISLYSPSMQWPQSKNQRKVVDFLIYEKGNPHQLTGRDKNRPNVTYSFDPLKRFRSSINWFRSGRPCPLCSIAIERSSEPKAEATIKKALNSAKNDPHRGSSKELEAIQTLNILSAITDAITLGLAIKNNDPHAADTLRYAEFQDLTNGLVHTAVLPTDPKCNHEGFYGK
ncbi:hypothetical protein [Corynebacterium sp. Marseille-Q2823]|uniref:hypothetical protein n=1 Tax=Corynebacterium sp. Marseille-Q2823 TaxID=2736606 RepID=UPI00158CBA55|nr:hypothetical protein [Corynebacterium sp. Marseille-Q2823]